MVCFFVDERVTVVNLEDGSILRAEEAPRRRDLERWLEEHPGYMVDRADPEEEVVSSPPHFTCVRCGPQADGSVGLFKFVPTAMCCV